MIAARPFIENNIHPTILVSAYHRALNEALKVIDELAITIDVTKDEEFTNAL